MATLSHGYFYEISLYLELLKPISLDQYLTFGSLPKIFDYTQSIKKQLYLEAYAQTYLKEEIWVEQFVRDLAPFRRFLEVAAQANGKLINFSNMARDIGVSDQTIQKYFSILEDTLLGFFLEPFHHSFRKRLSKTPKFYFFDLGVSRTLSAQLNISVSPSTSYYGELFEHFIILQCKQLASYYHRDYRFSYLKTKDNAAVDLVVERPGRTTLFIEIKSTEQVQVEHLTTLKHIVQDFRRGQAICFSRDTYTKQLEGIIVYPWEQGIKKYFQDI